MNQKILFICFANKSRSAMAKGLAQEIFPEEFYFDSAGIDAATNEGANPRAIAVLNDYGIDLTGHHSKNITDVDLSEFNHVIAMDSNIFGYVVKEYPEIRNRAILWQIEDPYFGTIDSYRSCAEEILENLKVLSDGLGLSKLVSRNPSLI